MSDTQAFSLALNASTHVRPAPDGGSYNINVDFISGEDDILAYSSEERARDAMICLADNEAFQISHLHLSREITWRSPPHRAMGKKEIMSGLETEPETQEIWEDADGIDELRPGDVIKDKRDGSQFIVVKEGLGHCVETREVLEEGGPGALVNLDVTPGEDRYLVKQGSTIQRFPVAGIEAHDEAEDDPKADDQDWLCLHDIGHLSVGDQLCLDSGGLVYTVDEETPTASSYVSATYHSAGETKPINLGLDHDRNYWRVWQATPEPTGHVVGIDTGALSIGESDVITMGFQKLQAHVHQTANNAGWYTDPETGNPIKRNFGEVVALMHSELSEALEADRKDLMDDKLPRRKGVEVEFADCIIRILDTAAALDLDIIGAILEKDAFNRNREDHKLENRRKEGGKGY